MTTIANILNRKYRIMAADLLYPYRKCILRDYDKSLEKVWHVEYYIWHINKKKKVRRRFTLSQDTAEERYREGRAAAREIDKVLKAGAYIGEDVEEESSAIDLSAKLNLKNINLQEAALYFKEYNKNILKPRTLETYRSDLKRFERYLHRNGLQKLKMNKFTNQMAVEFLDQVIIFDKVGNRTRNNVKNSIKTFFNFFINRSVLDENPFKNIADLPTLALQHTAFSKSQAKKVKDEIIRQGDTQLLLFISIIYYCALRPRYELRLLKVGDISEKTIRINAENAKNSKTEFVIIPTPLNDLINKLKIRTYHPDFYVFSYNDQPGDEPLGRNNLYNRHRRILEKLNLTGKYLDTYSWKHTGAIALFQATQNIELVRQQCRHSDIGTTQKYLRDLGQFVDYEQINKFPEF